MMLRSRRAGFIQIPILIAIFVGALLVGGGGYVGVKEYKKNQATQKEEMRKAEELKERPTSGDVTMLAFPSATSTIVESATKTYRNEAYGFEISYPLTWESTWGEYPEYSKAFLTLKHEKDNFTVVFGSYWDGGLADRTHGTTTVMGMERTRGTFQGCSPDGTCEYDTDIILCYLNCSEIIPSAKQSREPSVSLQHRCFGDETATSMEACIRTFDEIASTFKVIKK